MTNQEKKILETFLDAIPRMTEHEKDRLLAFGEGMALMVKRNNETRSSVAMTA